MSRRALILNGASGSLLLLVTLIISFVMSPFLVKQLGNANYGFWELILGLVGYLGILDLGVGPAVVRFVALSSGSGDQVALMKIINAGLASFLLAGVVGGLVVGCTAIHPAWIFGDVPLQLTEARYAIFLGALVLLLSFSRATLSASLMGLQLHRLVNLTRCVSAIAGAFVVRFVLPWAQPHALIALAIVVVGSSLIEIVVFGALLRRHVQSLVLNPFRTKFYDVKQLLGFGVKSAGIMASGSLMRQGVLFVLAHNLGTSAVTFYALSARLIDYSQQLSGAIGFSLPAYFATALGKAGMEGARDAWVSTTRVIQAIQSWILTCAVWLGVAFLSIWMGSEYGRQGAPVFYLLCCGLLLQILGCNGNRMLVSLNKHGYAAFLAVMFAVVCISVSIIACRQFGLAGAASGAALYMGGMALIEFYLVCRALDVNLASHALGSVAQNVPPIAIGSLVFFVIELISPVTSYADIFLHGIIGSVAFMLVAIFTVLSSAERSAVATGIREWIYRTRNIPRD